RDAPGPPAPPRRSGWPNPSSAGPARDRRRDPAWPSNSPCRRREGGGRGGERASSSCTVRGAVLPSSPPPGHRLAAGRRHLSLLEGGLSRLRLEPQIRDLEGVDAVADLGRVFGLHRARRGLHLLGQRFDARVEFLAREVGALLL